ncbi:MAG: Gfo/Idh/MocA family oxidoreductase [Legionellaceae bacterium]|nr:Gfo/Idh/MocA family oxidoreductase [Legionellaceae bacterium]MBP9776094.1 Gfo/Idh/MocA family oxidoreductase [Legionellaceae bacterium]
MAKLKCAVIGVGYLGRFHAQKYQLLEDTDLIAVCDSHLDTVTRVAQELNVQPILNYQDLFGLVDAVSIAVSTQAHYAIAKDCLQHGIHVLIEKPITETVEQADELITIATAKQLKLQVGHMERFNAARVALTDYLDCPLFIDSQRLAPFTPRGADVNVVLDLMIHDIDLIQTMVDSPIASIDAHGSPVLTSNIDIANARITFENRCVANVVASRISFKTERKTRIFQKKSYISIDYHHKKISVFQQGQGELFPGVASIDQQEITIEKNDALLDEIKSFVTCILQDTTPAVTGIHGRDALATAIQISELIEKNIAYHVSN